MKEQNLAIDTFVPALRTLAGVLDKAPRMRAKKARTRRRYCRSAWRLTCFR
jgi:hypothetical protein